MDSGEKILLEILNENSSNEKLSLREVMKQLRSRTESFSETEAILHLMEALIFESTERRGW
jgi:hypothetical protein